MGIVIGIGSQCLRAVCRSSSPAATSQEWIFSHDTGGCQTRMCACCALRCQEDIQKAGRPIGARRSNSRLNITHRRPLPRLRDDDSSFMPCILSTHRRQFSLPARTGQHSASTATLSLVFVYFHQFWENGPLHPRSASIYVVCCSVANTQFVCQQAYERPVAFVFALVLVLVFRLRCVEVHRTASVLNILFP